MGLLYLVALLVSLTGMVVLDRRFGLFFWVAPRRAAVVLAAGLVFFVVWDLAGIGLGIFFRGETAFMTGLQVAPELPVEELFFLALLCYVTMNLYGFSTRFVSRRSSGPRSARIETPPEPS
jgi:lycopene cyclase domain-containing protein